MGAQWKVINENYKNLEGKFFVCVYVCVLFLLVYKCENVLFIDVYV